MSTVKTLLALLLIGLIGLMGLTAVSVPVLAGEKIDETRKADKDIDVRIQNIAGSVIVEAWNKGSVEIKGELGDGTKRLDIEGDKDRLTINVVLPRRARDVEATYLEIKVPKGARVEIDTVSAEVEVRGLETEIEVDTVSGSIDVDCHLVEAELNSVSGRVRMSGSVQMLDAESVSGDVELERLEVEELEAETVSGDIELDLGDVKRVDCESVSGDIELSGGIIESGDFETQSGNVELSFDGEPDARFEISTFSGDIRNDFGPRPRRAGKYEPGEELQFESGKGKADISIETFSGDVILSK